MKKPEFQDVLGRAQEIYSRERRQDEDREISREVAQELDIPPDYLKKAEAELIAEQARRGRKLRTALAIGGSLLAVVVLWAVLGGGFWRYSLTFRNARRTLQYRMCLLR